MEWQDIQGTFVNLPPPVMSNNSTTLITCGTSNMMTLDLSSLIPKTSRMAMISLRNVNALSFTRASFRDTLLAGYGHIATLYNTAGAAVQQTCYAPLDTSQVT